MEWWQIVLAALPGVGALIAVVLPKIQATIKGRADSQRDAIHSLSADARQDRADASASWKEFSEELRSTINEMWHRLDDCQKQHRESEADRARMGERLTILEAKK